MTTIEVLMIEDNRGDVVLVASAIEKLGLPYHLNVLSEGAEAIEFLHQRGKYVAAVRPDLIMVDLQLPRGSGREVLSDIQQHPQLMDIPFVLMSSSKAELESAHSLALPAACYLEKPSTYQGFVAMVEHLERLRSKTF